MKDTHDTTSPLEERATTIERTVNLPRDTALAVAEDSLAPGTRKPSSDRVDRERNLRAQSERRTDER